MEDTIYALWYRDGISVITFGVVVIIGSPIGAFISSLFRKEFKQSEITIIKIIITNIIRAILVGIGRVIGHDLIGISIFFRRPTTSYRFYGRDCGRLYSLVI